MVIKMPGENKREVKPSRTLKTEKPKFYKVEEGELFHEIATSHGISVGTLSALNGGKRDVKAGDLLNLAEGGE